MKRIFPFAIACLMSLPVLAQYNKKIIKPPVQKDKPVVTSGFYVKLGGGYAFTQAGQTTDKYGYPYSGYATYVSGSNFSSFEMKKVSFAAGVQGLFGLGYTINKNVGVEIDGMVGIANEKYKTRNKFPTTSEQVDQSITTYAKNPFFIVPSLVLQTSNKKFNIYSRAGIALPIAMKLIEEHTDRVTLNTGIETNVYDYTIEHSFKFSIGFSGATGASYKIGKYTHVWMEAVLFSISAFAKDETLTSYKKDGVSLLNQVQPANRTTKYSYTSGSGVDPSYSYPFTSIGINAGLKLDL